MLILLPALPRWAQKVMVRTARQWVKKMVGDLGDLVALGAVGRMMDSGDRSSLAQTGRRWIHRASSWTLRPFRRLFAGGGLYTRLTGTALQCEC